jgi:hypothetical protein
VGSLRHLKQRLVSIGTGHGVVYLRTASRSQPDLGTLCNHDYPPQRRPEQGRVPITQLNSTWTRANNHLRRHLDTSNVGLSPSSP